MEKYTSVPPCDIHIASLNNSLAADPKWAIYIYVYICMIISVYTYMCICIYV
jgi:hypothetical protein